MSSSIYLILGANTRAASGFAPLYRTVNNYGLKLKPKKSKNA